jgi:thiamine biosynthesis lipoprotein
MQSGGLATSGDYERFFTDGENRYCHILNAKTGMPVNYWQSVSIMANNAITAGACSTIAMLKEKEGIDFLESCGFSYLAINRDGVIHQKSSQTA